MTGDGQLPAGWMWASLEELLTSIEAGKSFKCDERRPMPEEVGVVKVSAVSWGEYKEQESKTCMDSERVNAALLIRQGDFLFSRANTIDLVGACVIAGRVPRSVMLSDKILRFHFACDDLKPWVLHWLRGSDGRAQIESLSSGNQDSMRNIGQKRIGQIQVPLPPTAEREEILGRVEEASSGLGAAVQDLLAAKRKLALYRQSLLKSAVDGSLTADLRDRSSVDGFNSNWQSTTVAATGEVQLGRQRAPRYHEGDNLLLYLRVANVFEERIDTTDVMTMHFSKADEERYLLKHGDILLNEGQSPELVGRPAMFNGELDRVCFTNTLIRYRPYRHVEAAYALLVFLHYLHSGVFRSLSPITTNIAHLGAGRFAQAPFPLPPIDEQREIVRRFEASRSAIREQLLAVDRALAMAAAQRQNILRAAFSGRLVPQDPNDEPASVLLDRIRTQCTASAAAEPRAKRRTAPRLAG